MPRKAPIRNSEFRIAWICAIPIEMEVARRALDEEYIDPTTGSSRRAGRTAAIAGRIGAHNIVIACCFNARKTGAATILAERLIGEYVNLQLGLMVGIGGGIPYWGHDLRLGDVIVSQPECGTSGIVSWDAGVIAKDGFQYRGTFAAPPDILLKAAQELDTRRTSRPHDFASQLQNCTRTINDRFSPPIARPPPSSDPRKTSDRPRPTSAPAIHRGVIASGRSVMASARKRDAIAQDIHDKRGGLRVLCMEMEAAELANSLPSLVVRGVSDYADQRKADAWQPAAALAAAAYARLLLLALPAAAVARDRTRARLELSRASPGPPYTPNVRPRPYPPRAQMMGRPPALRNACPESTLIKPEGRPPAPRAQILGRPPALRNASPESTLIKPEDRPPAPRKSRSCWCF